MLRKRLYELQDRIRSSYWFLPSVMAILALPLSVAAIYLDQVFQNDLRWVMGLVYVDSPEAARTVLSTIASSMITVAGVVFSLTMVVLSLTSQQYGSLVLVNFMRDRVNQSVLGIFTATFIYCLLVLRTIRGTTDSMFIPHIAVLLGLGLSIASFAVLIYYIHHVSESIQAASIIARVSRSLHDAVDSLFPDMIGHEDGYTNDKEKLYQQITNAHQQISIHSQEQGYIQYVDNDALLKFAEKYDVIVELKERPGQFIVKGDVLSYIWANESTSDNVEDKINNAIFLGKQRTPGQDIEFIITQISSIAVRALSPSLNDPYTAVQCINRFEGAFCRLVNRQFPSEYRYDEQNKLRVIAHPITLSNLLRVAFDEICHYGHADSLVMETVLQTLVSIRRCTGTPDRQQLIDQYIERCFHVPKV